MTNGAVALLRKRWASLIAWVAAMDLSGSRLGDESDALRVELLILYFLPQPVRASSGVHSGAQPRRTHVAVLMALSTFDFQGA